MFVPSTGTLTTHIFDDITLTTNVFVISFLAAFRVSSNKLLSKSLLTKFPAETSEVKRYPLE